MTTRSKVWPVLLKNSLNLGPEEAAVDLPQDLRKQQQLAADTPNRQVNKFSNKSLSIENLRHLIGNNLAKVAAYCRQQTGCISRYLQCCCCCCATTTTTTHNCSWGCFSCRDRLANNNSTATTTTFYSNCGSCNPATSDIFCVAGAITAITGSFIAGFGVFPRNQARIRLYLECIGCAMVIMGMLIVFISKKMMMQPSSFKRQIMRNHQRARDETVDLVWPPNGNIEENSQHIEPPQPPPPQNMVASTARGRGSRRLARQGSTLSRSSSMTTSSIDGSQKLQTVAIPLNELVINHQHPVIFKANNGRPADDSISSPAIVESGGQTNKEYGSNQVLEIACCMTRASSDHILAASSGPTRGNSNSNSNSQHHHHHLHRTHHSAARILENTATSADENLADGSQWIPDNDDGYGADHQAAIEAVLSTVLTVSTLVGFRSDHSEHNHCCLHHAVQHKMNARKWLNRLNKRRTVLVKVATTRNNGTINNNNNSNNQLTVPPNARLMEAETSLTSELG